MEGSRKSSRLVRLPMRVCFINLLVNGQMSKKVESRKFKKNIIITVESLDRVVGEEKINQIARKCDFILYISILVL